MAFLLEVLFQAFAEIFLQLAFELLAEAGLHRARKSSKRRPNPWLAALGYACLGAACGGISLLLFPTPFLKMPIARIVNLVLTPIAAGVGMAALGAWRRRKGQPLLRIDRFSYGYLFSHSSMAVMRFVAAG